MSPGKTRLKDVNPVIPVHDMKATLKFYQDGLGFKKVFDDASDSGSPVSYAGVRRGGVCLHLQEMVPGEEPTMPLIRIRVENIEPLYNEYKAQGLIGPGCELESKPWGSRDFGIFDPNGAALVFYEDI
jgi:uncharacterized glyoxalase superfamily protein PhnB